MNTGNGWATWNANGDFAKFYIQDSVSNGIVPVLTYYMMRQSLPGANESESAGNYDNMQNTQTMTAYYNDLKLFFQKAGALPIEQGRAARRAGPLGVPGAEVVRERRIDGAGEGGGDGTG